MKYLILFFLLLPFTFFNCQETGFNCQETEALEIMVNRTDTDGDGLPNYIEESQGTSISYPDTDSDGLSDYYEIRKYSTDPLKKDSDSDGVIDSEWDERREYTYSIQVIVELRWPYDLDIMNDFFQDARIVKENGEVTTLEVIIYPEARGILLDAPYSPVSNSPFVAATHRKDVDDEMKTIARGLIPEGSTLVGAVEKIREFLSDFEHHNVRVPFDIFTDKGRIIEKKRFIPPSADPPSFTWEQVKERVIYASTMLKHMTRGDCGSYSSLLGALYRAAGIEERTIHTIPINFRYQSDKTIVKLKQKYYYDYQTNSKGWGPEDLKGQEGFIIYHFINEIKIGNHWFMYDDKWVGLKNRIIGDLFIRLFAIHDTADLSAQYYAFASDDPKVFFDHRPYKFVSIIEQMAVH